MNSSSQCICVTNEQNQRETATNNNNCILPYGVLQSVNN